MLLATSAFQRILNFTADEVRSGLIGWSSGIAIAFVLYRFVALNPWPRPFRARFALLHVVAAPAFAFAWHTMMSVLQTLIAGKPFGGQLGFRVDEHIFIGCFLYAILAGIFYAFQGAARASRAEATSARTQLAALRAQLHPHFLFNALHTVVQLIPVDPKRAVEAAELVADLLRTTLEEQRDEVSLSEEWRFVSRYLSVERIRFGDRLIVRDTIPDDLLGDRVPAFAMQTLVENAVRHGAAPSVAPTTIVISVSGSRSELTVSVRNSGGDPGAGSTKSGSGTGLARLRERLSVLHGNAARLECGPDGNGGFIAAFVVPRSRARDS